MRPWPWNRLAAEEEMHEQFFVIDLCDADENRYEGSNSANDNGDFQETTPSHQTTSVRLNPQDYYDDSTEPRKIINMLY